MRGLLSSSRPASAAEGPESAPESARSHGSWTRHLRRPYTWIAALLVVTLAVWWFAIRDDGSSSPTVSTTAQLVTVTRGTMSDTVSAEGTVEAAQTDDLSFSAAGTVNAVNVKAGDAVTAGEVLATIDSAQLQSSVSAAQSTLASAQAKLADDQAAGASDAQLEADQTTITSASDALGAAQQALAGSSLVATFDGTIAQVNVTVGEQLGSSGTGGTSGTGSASGSGRSSSTLGSGNTSPFGGSANNSSSSASSSPQIQVVSKGSYTVSLPISSNDISSVASGQSVSLTVSTASTNGFPGGFGGGRFGGIFRQLGGGGANGNGATNGATANGGGAAARATATGTVTDVAQVASASSGVATYPVTVAFTDSSNQIDIGTTVTGAIATNVRQNVLQVPILAVSTSNGTSTVTVATKGKLPGPEATRPVTIGATANGMVEITSGLREGESVVERVPKFSTTNGSEPTNGQFPRGGFGGVRGAGGGGGAGAGGG
jgi:multidrug efflux pump subunit AcrA (membrane-fusion protein)